MRARRRTNFLWGLVVLVIALVVMAQTLGMIPEAVFDLLLRTWPVVLVLAGLSIVLRDRVPFSGLVAVVLSVALTAGVAVYAFSSRAQEQRTDYQEEISEPVSDGLGLLRVRVATLATDVEVLRSVDTSIRGTFVGSLESTITADYDEPGDGSGTFTLREDRPGQIPRLEAVGRGRLRLELPPDVPLDVEVVGGDGDVTLNLRETELERLNLDLARGDSLVILPDYEPVSAEQGQSQGTLAVREGSITVVVPSSVAARLELERGSGIDPEYDPNIYNFLFNRVLEARAIELADVVVEYAIVAPRGGIRLEVEPVDETASGPDTAGDNN